MLLHPLFEVLLGVADVRLAGHGVNHFVDEDGLSADVVVQAGTGAWASAVAFTVDEVKRFDSFGELLREVALENVP